ncbi:MAG: hypothetical protein QOF84_4919 [Streptomyces sp.]|jgi:predicted NBD/HSP70 family sugar kinase|nr:hypothetical protein [Streptomyces sp.]
MGERNGRTVRDLRRGSRAAVLQRLYFAGPLSRQELGPATGLSSGSISNVVGDLVAEGLVEEAGAVDSDGGRPRTLLRVAPGHGCVIGIDVGETRVRAALFDLSLTEVALTERLLSRHVYDTDRIVRHILDAMADLLRDTGARPDRLLGVGIGVPGMVVPDADGHAVVHGQTIGWDAVPLEAVVRAEADIPAHVRVHVDNGAKTLGQAETWFGAGQGARDVAVALLGSGVGACIVKGGTLGGAADGTAIEWGHTTVKVGGRRCRCGARGCLEAYVGAEGLLERWYEVGGEAPDGDDETALAALIAAARPRSRGHRPDPAAATLLAETAEYLGAGVATLVNLFAPERILIGGWAGLLLGHALLPEVRRHAEAYALHYPAGRATIELSRLGPDAVTLGAATLPLADFLQRGGAAVVSEPSVQVRPTPVPPGTLRR